MKTKKDKGFVGICPKHKTDYRKCDECMPEPNWEKKFSMLENHLICLSENQVQAIIQEDKEDSQRLWQDQMNAIKFFFRQKIEEAYEQGLHETAIRIDKEMIEWLKNNQEGVKMIEEITKSAKKSLLQEIQEEMGGEKTPAEMALKNDLRMRCIVASENYNEAKVEDKAIIEKYLNQS